MDDEARQDEPVHTPDTRRGEEIKELDGKEPGREDTGTTGPGRETGESTARDSTLINDEDLNPIDPESPYLPPA